MNTQLKKSLMIGFGVFAFIVLTIGVVYLVRKPSVKTALPTPKPTMTAVASPTTAPIFVVDQVSACTKTFVVACATTSPSPSPSSIVYASPSPSTPSASALKCVSKKMYEDDSRNRAGFYYLEKEITDTNTLSNGQIITYNVMTKNAGGNSAPDTVITDTLSTNLTYLDGDSGCSYNSANRVVTCTIGTLSANSEAQRSFRATVSVVGTASVANTAEVTSTNGQRDSCSVRIDATGKVVSVASPAPTALPVAGVFEITAGTLGAGLLLLVAGALGLLLI